MSEPVYVCPRCGPVAIPKTPEDLLAEVRRHRAAESTDPPGVNVLPSPPLK